MDKLETIRKAVILANHPDMTYEEALEAELNIIGCRVVIKDVLWIDDTGGAEGSGASGNDDVEYVRQEYGFDDFAGSDEEHMCVEAFNTEDERKKTADDFEGSCVEIVGAELTLARVMVMLQKVCDMEGLEDAIYGNGIIVLCHNNSTSNRELCQWKPTQDGKPCTVEDQSQETIDALYELAEEYISNQKDND